MSLEHFFAKTFYLITHKNDESGLYKPVKFSNEEKCFGANVVLNGIRE